MERTEQYSNFCIDNLFLLMLAVGPIDSFAGHKWDGKQMFSRNRGWGLATLKSPFRKEIHFYNFLSHKTVTG